MASRQQRQQPGRRRRRQGGPQASQQAQPSVENSINEEGLWLMDESIVEEVEERRRVEQEEEQRISRQVRSLFETDDDGRRWFVADDQRPMEEQVRLVLRRMPITHLLFKATCTHRFRAGVNCDQTITHVKIGPAVTSIGQYTFQSRKKLASLDISEGSLLEEIGAEAIFGCESLKELRLPASFRRFGIGALAGCGLVEIDLSNCPALVDIPSYTFFGCKNLRRVVFPPNLQSIDVDAFTRCGLFRVVASVRALRNIGFQEEKLQLIGFDQNSHDDTTNISFLAAPSSNLPLPWTSEMAQRYGFDCVGCDSLGCVTWSGPHEGKPRIDKTPWPELFENKRVWRTCFRERNTPKRLVKIQELSLKYGFLQAYNEVLFTRRDESSGKDGNGGKSARRTTIADDEFDDGVAKRPAGETAKEYARTLKKGRSNKGDNNQEEEAPRPIGGRKQEEETPINAENGEEGPSEPNEPGGHQGTIGNQDVDCNDSLSTSSVDTDMAITGVEKRSF